MNPVFDQPDSIGPLVWWYGWREPSSLSDRLLATIAVGVFGGGSGAVWLHHDLGVPSAVCAGGFALVCFAAFVFFGPDRRCYCAGERGASISRLRFGFLKSRDVLLYDEADDVELESTRIVSDAVGQIYMRTDLEVSFIDREGYEVFSIKGTIDEPAQRAGTTYDPTAALQLDGPTDRGAEFGFAAMDAFRKFKDQRPVSPYR